MDWKVSPTQMTLYYTLVQGGRWFCPLITWTRPTCWVTASPSSPKDSCTAVDPLSSSKTVSELVSIWLSCAGWRISRGRRWGWLTKPAQCAPSMLFILHLHTHTDAHTTDGTCLTSIHVSVSSRIFFWTFVLFPAVWLWLRLRLLLFLLHLYQIQRPVPEQVPAARQSSGW